MKIKNKEVKGVIFDLDGTLLDSCSIWADVDQNFFLKRGIEMPSDYGEKIAHIGLENAAIYTINEFHLNEKKEDIIKEWKNGVLEEYAHNVKLKPHVKEFLEYLKLHHIPFCAATANDSDCYKSALINNDIYNLFDFILEVNHYASKDKPDIFYEACKRLNTSPNNTFVFEDLPLAIITAKNANFRTVAVFEATSKESDEQVKKEIADFYIHDFDELQQFIGE